jgi:hypothetical protein
LAQPRLIPTGDVDVLYHLSGPAADQVPGAAGGVRLQWDAEGQRLRSEPVGGPVYAITDLGRHVADIVFAAQNTYLELPLRVGNPEALVSGAAGEAQFTRGGAATVLGLACTEWTIHARKLDATGCITADGVVLRADGTWNGQDGHVEAVSVKRSHTAADRFRPPEGFFRINLKGGK